MEALSKYGLPALAVILGIAAFPLASSGIDGAGLYAALGSAIALCASAIVHSARLGAAVTAAGCMAANLYLLSEKWFPGDAPALCSVNEVVDCAKVNDSVYSEMFGIPITLLGAAFYLGLLIAALGGPKTAPRFHQVNGLFAILNLAYSAYLASASASLGLICPFCISIYIGNILLFWAALKGLNQTNGKLFGDIGSVFTSRSFLVISAATVGLVFLGGTAWQNRVTEPSMPEVPGDPTAGVERFFAAAPGEVVLDGSEPVLGDPNAPYTVVEWADFGCPHCAKAGRELKQLVSENPNVQVRFKAFPLSGDCNPGLESRGPDRCLAAAAAECARPQGKFWDMSANIFRNQGYMTADDLRFMAKDEGLDLEQWERCLFEEQTMDGVVADAIAGQKAGVMGTPTLFLKGTHGDRWVLITHGVDALMNVLKVHQAGHELPEPGPAPAAMH